MKKYILGLTIAASTLSLAGCSDFLDTPVLGQQDLSEYFVNEDQCKQQITGCYQSIFWDDWWQVQKFYLCGDMCTDDMWVGNTGEDQGAYEDLAFLQVMHMVEENVVRTSGNIVTRVYCGVTLRLREYQV